MQLALGRKFFLIANEYDKDDLPALFSAVADGSTRPLACLAMQHITQRGMQISGPRPTRTRRLFQASRGRHDQYTRRPGIGCLSTAHVILFENGLMAAQLSSRMEAYDGVARGKALWPCKSRWAPPTETKRRRRHNRCYMLFLARINNAR